MADKSMVGILPNDDERLHKVIMSNITKTTTEEQVKEFLKEKCEITDSNIVSCALRAPANKEKPTVLAEVIFDSTLTTDTCISKLYAFDDKERQLDTHTMNMRRALPDYLKRDPTLKLHALARSTKLSVANLPKSGYDKSKLEEELKSRIDPLVESEGTNILGGIKDYEVRLERGTENVKGIAFINVTSEHIADKLSIQCGGGFDIGGRRIALKKNLDPNYAGSRGGRGGRGGMMGWGAPPPRGGFAQRGGGFAPRGRGTARGAGRGGRGGFASNEQMWGYPQQQQQFNGYQEGYAEWY